VRTLADLHSIKPEAFLGGLELSYPAWLATQIAR
jgi:hypothetical protein